MTGEMIHSEPSEGFAMRRFELTDEQFSRIAALLPGKDKDPGRTAADGESSR